MKKQTNKTEKTAKPTLIAFHVNLKNFFTFAATSMTPLPIWQPLGESNSSCLDENQMS